MNLQRNAFLALLRCGILAATIAALVVAGGLPLRGIHVVLGWFVLVLFVGGLVAQAASRGRPAVPLLLLAADLLVIGAAGTFLVLPEAAGESARGSLPFVAGFLVAALLAATGRRLLSAAVGLAAGAMLLVLGESVVPHPAPVHPVPLPRGAPAPATIEEARPPYDPSGPPDARDTFLLLRLLLIAAGSLACAVVTGRTEAEIRRRRTAESVERELRARETLASEMVALGAAAAAATSLSELGEALLSHLRRNFPVRARAFALDACGERVAVWEESGRVDDAVVEARRERMRAALGESGALASLERLDVRGIAASGAARVERLLSAVTVPIQADGRSVGILHIADPKRNAITDDRLGALAELARTIGDAVARMDRARGEQSRRTSLLLGQMREGVLLLGPDARVVLSNPAGREMLRAMGCPADAPVTLGELRPSELSRLPAGVVRRASGISAVGPEGKALRLGVSAVGVADAGTRLGTLVTLTDVTEEEQARRRLVQAEKMSVVGQTLASVAHELNNPLAAIVGYADLLGESKVAPDVERILARIREQATRTSRIVKNLLNVARRRGPERTRVSLNDVVTSVTDLFAYDAKLSNIQLVPELDPDLPPILADRHALQQILVNLVQNAIQALRARGGPGQVEIRTSKEGGAVRLSVADDGPGIAPAARARLFEAFFTTKGADGGTGLGLAISRGIAREHLGDLVCEDRSDGRAGAQFTLRLPLSDRPIAEPGAPRAIPDGVPARVLVVDDEAAVRDALVAQLGRLGARVESAGTPDEATRLLASGEPWDAVLLDVRLPGRSGLDVHKTLRATNAALAQRVVFMTGDLVNDDVIEAVKATGNTLLEKPFTADELKVALASAGPAA